MKYRTVFTEAEAKEQFGEYLSALVTMGLAEGFKGYRDTYYYGVIVGDALDQIEEFKANEREATK